MIDFTAETLQCLRLSAGANQIDDSPHFADCAARFDPFAARSNKHDGCRQPAISDLNHTHVPCLVFVPWAIDGFLTAARKPLVCIVQHDVRLGSILVPTLYNNVYAVTAACSGRTLPIYSVVGQPIQVSSLGCTHVGAARAH